MNSTSFNHHKKFATTLIGTLLCLCNGSFNPVFAKTYYAAAPNPPKTWKTNDVAYVSSNVDGDDFFVGVPFKSQVTRDENLYVTSIVLIKKPNGVILGSFIQFNCGMLYYRNISAWVKRGRNGNYISEERPNTYSWQRTMSGSVMENVEKYLCTEAAIDRGINWVWYR